MKTTLQAVIKTWPDAPRESAERLIQYYGEPFEYSSSFLVWGPTKDGWKRTILSGDETLHLFPSEHTDFVQQTINYKVPVEMISALTAYDGSLVVNRTKGELSASCSGTTMNFVAINLAHDLILGNTTVEQAREEYARLFAAYKAGEKPPYAQGFQFELSTDTADPDIATLAL